jgi:hypothetical protein
MKESSKGLCNEELSKVWSSDDLDHDIFARVKWLVLEGFEASSQVLEELSNVKHLIIINSYGQVT